MESLRDFLSLISYYLLFQVMALYFKSVSGESGQNFQGLYFVCFQNSCVKFLKIILFPYHRQVSNNPSAVGGCGCKSSFMVKQ